MSWGSTPADPQQLEWMKEAGINVAGFAQVKDLSAFERAGLQVFVSDRRANGYDFEKPLDEAAVRSNLESLAREIGNSPAVLGLMLRDETAREGHAQSRARRATHARVLPRKVAVCELVPGACLGRPDGTATYQEYVRLLVDTIRQPFLSYDNYSAHRSQMGESFFQNLEVVRRCRRNRRAALELRALQCPLQLHGEHGRYLQPAGLGRRWLTGARDPVLQLLHLVERQLPARPHRPVREQDSVWDMMRRVNNQIHALAPTLTSLKSTGVYHYPDVPPDCSGLTDSRLVQLIEMRQRGVVPPVQGRSWSASSPMGGAARTSCS